MDEAASGTFYTGLFEWTAESFGGGGRTYTLFKKDGMMVGGMMTREQPNLEASASLCTMPPSDELHSAQIRPFQPFKPVGMLFAICSSDQLKHI